MTVNQYLDLIEAVNAGFGLDDLNSLREICRLLWAHSQEQVGKVDFYFDRELVQRHEKKEGNLPEKKLDEPKQKAEQAPRNDSGSSVEKKTPKPTPISDEQQRKIDAANAVTIEREKEIQTELHAQLTRRYILKLRFTHLSQRTSAQAWRKLRSPSRIGPKTEFDLDETIKSVTEMGFFLQPKFQKRVENIVDVRFLIDREGSMVPSHSFINSLLHDAMTIGGLPKIETRYFHDYPNRQLFREEILAQPQGVDRWLRTLDSKHSIVVIFSDAGAARMTFDDQRIKGTKLFLEKLQNYCKRIAWINPMPSYRWLDNSAAKISCHVPMFEANTTGLNHAIDFLRGAKSVSRLRNTETFDGDPSNLRS